MTIASIALPRPRHTYSVTALVAAFCLLWASAFSVAKLAIADCPPLLLLTFRFLLAGVLMLGAAAINGVPLKTQPSRSRCFSRRSASPIRPPISVSAISA